MKAIAYIKQDARGEQDSIFRLPQKYEPVLNDLGNGLLVAYLIERNNSFDYIQAWHLREEDITKDRMYEIGLKNLRRKASENLRIRAYKNIYAIFLDGNFEASLILINELWEKTLKQYIKNDYIVAIPTRDILAFCDSESQEGIRDLQILCKRIESEGANLLSADLFERLESRWVKFGSKGLSHVLP